MENKHLNGKCRFVNHLKKITCTGLSEIYEGILNCLGIILNVYIILEATCIYLLPQTCILPIVVTFCVPGINLVPMIVPGSHC